MRLACRAWPAGGYVDDLMDKELLDKFFQGACPGGALWVCMPKCLNRDLMMLKTSLWS